MLAVDTNVIVRYLTRDDAEQFARASARVVGEDVYVCTTVLLETEWVLRSVYRYPPARVVEALRAFAGMPRVRLEDPALAATALDWMARGMDFADALHLAGTELCDGFISFDRQLIAIGDLIIPGKVRAP
jgi:predicted nucleic-acid-binding protein